MFTTGISLCAASSSTTAWSPLRTPTACTWRASTRAVSRGDSPRESCNSSARSTRGWPPISTIPASNDTRVRVEGFSNSSATWRPWSTREASGSAFSSSPRSISPCSSSGVSSEPVMKCRAKRESVRVRVVSWNLYGGRAKPPAGRSLLAEFAATLAGWQWDVALLQEVPPWWPPKLAEAAGADQRRVLTARNWGRPIRRWLGERDPDRWGSWAGGSNAILARGPQIVEHRKRRLRWLPERRWMHGVRLED